MSKVTGQTHSGSFTVDGRQIQGTLTEAGEKSQLYLHDPNFFHIPHEKEIALHGVLHNLVKVSLLDCICPGTGSIGMKDNHVYNAKVFPHYIVSGERHLGPQDDVISEIAFRITDAHTLFYDYEAFGHVIHGEKFIDALANADNKQGDPNVATGPYPEIFYFTGVYEMANFETALGTFTARHSPSYRSPGPWGLEFNNAIVTGLKFAAPLNFQTALRRLIDLNRYLAVLIGRPQNISDVTLVVPVAGEEHPQRLAVDWCLVRRYDYQDDQRQPHPADVLLEPIRAKEAFASVTAAYFARNTTWGTARLRYANNFEEGRSYTIDRLVSAANMFDILPDSVFGPAPVLGADVLAAQKTARQAFKVLADSPDRVSILSALGRLGKWTLKKKIASRLPKFVTEAQDRYPELTMVTEEAVNARNFFVHGGQREFDHGKYERLLWFFVDTLEFVFAASDLGEAGWSVKAWADRSSVSHPFGSYTLEYKADLALLKKALAEGPPIPG